MTKRLLFSFAAEQDLHDIWEYIARDNLVAASRFVDAIEGKCSLLFEYPEIGKQREELSSGLRSFPIKDYIVFYRPIKTHIEIVRVVRASRDLLRLFE